MDQGWPLCYAATPLHPITSRMSRFSTPSARPAQLFRHAFGAPIAAAFFALISGPAQAQTAPNVYINEVNYDTPGVDDITSEERIEYVEIVAPAGFDTAGWALVIYDGSDGSVTERRDFPEDSAGDTVFPDQVNGFGFLAIRISQPDGVGGVALVDDEDNVVQFLSYEGTFTASEGPANGLESTQIPLPDPDQPSDGGDVSLQLLGTGTSYSDFRWTNDRALTPNEINSGQSIDEPYLVALSLSPASVTEGAQATLTATLSRAATEAVTVSLAYSGTSTEGDDFAAVSAVTIASGETTGSTMLTTTDDATFEEDETVVIDVSDVDGSDATEDGDQQVTLTIEDNDSNVATEGGATDGSSLALYPNPSAGRVSVDLVVASLGTARVAVYDALGREVTVLYDGPVSGSVRVPVEAGDLAPGTYVVRAVTSGTVLTQTLSVVR